MEQTLESLSVGDLKKRLFWVGASLPDGHIEKSDLVTAVRKAEAEQEEKFAKKGTSAEEKQIIDLHLLSEAQLQEKIEQNGHDVPPNSSKHYLVALCRKALKDPREPKPKKKEETAEPENAIAEYRRPTIGDRVQIRDTMVMKRYLPEAIGKVFRIIKDDGGAFPYRLAGVGEQRHWFGEDDVCWPTRVQTKVFKRAGGKANPDQPAKVMINHNRYGCTQGEVRDVLGETADKKSWVLQGGRQVPKAHEHSGWSRIQAETADAPPPPPSAPPGAVTLSEAEIFAQMEEMQAQMDAEAEQPGVPSQVPSQVPSGANGANGAAQSPSPPVAKAAELPTNEGTEAPPGAGAKAAEVTEASPVADKAPTATVEPSKSAAAAGQEARRKRKEAMEAKAKAAAEAEERRKARRKAAAEKAAAAAVDPVDVVEDDEVRAVEVPISID
eukprot:Skav211996  [mRNA]  locus=scaffold2069:143463:145088:- [translate_table: standard]